MKFFILAGEASGDLHGSRLIQSFLDLDRDTSFAYWGGDHMEKIYPAGLRKHIREMGFMGFVEILKHLRTILRQFKEVHNHILDFKPDALILIDYPGFNLRLAKWAHQQKIPVYYYISPQVWAWKANRVEKIRQYVKKLFVILPFEKQWFAERKVEVEYIGHPLVNIIQEFRDKYPVQNQSTSKIIAVLPGSRKQEIQKMLPRMIKMADLFPDYQFVIAGRKEHGTDFYKRIIQNSNLTSSLRFEKLENWNAFGPCFLVLENCALLLDSTYTLLNRAQAGLITSGTATLETALFNVPEVVCYAGSPLSFWLAKKLVKVPYISLVNLIADKEVVKELIQNDLNESLLKKQLEFLLDPEKRRRILDAYAKIRQNLAKDGALPSMNAASYIIEDIRN